jgi:hypothetical protein
MQGGVVHQAARAISDLSEEDAAPVRVEHDKVARVDGHAVRRLGARGAGDALPGVHDRALDDLGARGAGGAGSAGAYDQCAKGGARSGMRRTVICAGMTGRHGESGTG